MVLFLWQFCGVERCRCRGGGAGIFNNINFLKLFLLDPSDNEVAVSILWKILDVWEDIKVKK